MTMTTTRMTTEQTCWIPYVVEFGVLEEFGG